MRDYQYKASRSTPVQVPLVHAAKNQKVDPILWIIINLLMEEIPLMVTLLWKHPHINFQPYKQLIKEQTAIGWDQIKYSWWSKQWKILQICFNSTAADTRDSPWQNKIIQQVWQHAHLRQKTRNAALHKKHQSDTTKANLLARIKAAYTHQPNMLVQDRQPFQKSLEDWETQQASVMKLWLLQNLPYIQHCVQVTKTQIAMQNKDIRDFVTGNPKTTQIKDPVRKRRKRRKVQYHKNIAQFLNRKQPRSTGINQSNGQQTKYYKSQYKPPDQDNPDEEKPKAP
eukprot:184199-Ditylum_brightwellii.AAC.1